MNVYDDWAFLVSGQVHPDARGRGFYRALVAHRLRMAHELGLRFAATEAQEDTSYPMLMRWRFRCLAWKETYKPPS